MLKKTGVNIVLNTEYTPETLESNPCDILIVATGASVITPKIAGSDTNKFLSATKVLATPELADDEIVVIGGGQVGVETSIWLAQKVRKFLLLK